MNIQKHSDSPHPAWDVFVHHLQSGQVPEPALMRGAYEEHERIEEHDLQQLYSEAMELREDWKIDAMFLKPQEHLPLEKHVEKVVKHHAETSPKPLLPRFPFIARIPFLRRFFR